MKLVKVLVIKGNVFEILVLIDDIVIMKGIDSDVNFDVVIIVKKVYVIYKIVIVIIGKEDVIV